ncbi:MAG: hypothetical protein MUO31_02250 [Thermodesulfovibrionales bacterium]|nr:hypothetical protein [Thermodesulfovibrionales bacterium]
MQYKILAKGFGGINKVVAGKVIEWREGFFCTPSVIKEAIIYVRKHLPLFQTAFLIENNVKAVLIGEGGKNYHPLILLNDAMVPAIAGLGDIDLPEKEITIDSKNGIIYHGFVELPKKNSILTSPKTVTKIYVNVGYPSALTTAAKTGADGIGLLRTEFISVGTLSKILFKKYNKKYNILDAIINSNEADILYAISKNKIFREYLKIDYKDTFIKAMNNFGQKEIIIRTLDIARKTDEPMGNRGIRRCISEGGDTIKMLAESIKEALLQTKGDFNIGIILPLVSHYSQIKTSLDIILSSGLVLKKKKNDYLGIKFGWEIEQPAASENNEIWLLAFQKEYGISPHYIGIGTNDLTQFTVALGRDAIFKETNIVAKNYLENLYDESDLSVIRQIMKVASQCKHVGTKVLLLGQAASRPTYAELVISLGIIPSVEIENVRNVRTIAKNYEKQYNKTKIFNKYINKITNQYPVSIRKHIRKKLSQIMETNSG